MSESGSALIHATGVARSGAGVPVIWTDNGRDMTNLVEFGINLSSLCIFSPKIRRSRMAHPLRRPLANKCGLECVPRLPQHPFRRPERDLFRG